MRISRHQAFMEIARTMSKRSTCHRLNVGAVIVIKNRVVATGYNGPASGEPHCQGNSCNLGSSGGCLRSIHAEHNAFLYLPPGMEVEEKVIYCTHSPCQNCAKLIKLMCVTHVYYETPYRNFQEPLQWLLDNGVEVSRYSPSGYLVNHRDNTVEEV